MLTIYSGLMGSGKSYHAVAKAKEYLLKGKNVYVNFYLDFRDYQPPKTWIQKIFFFIKPKPLIIPWQNCYRFNDISDLAYMRNGICILDEGHWNLFSRDWKDLDKRTVGYITNSRKIEMDIVIITQSFGMLDVIARSLTSSVVVHNAFGGGWTKQHKPKAPWIVFFKEFDPLELAKTRKKSFYSQWTVFDKNLADCYSTHQIFGVLPEDAKTFKLSYEN